jgi:hypothetical protein
MHVHISLSETVLRADGGVDNEKTHSRNNKSVVVIMEKFFLLFRPRSNRLDPSTGPSVLRDSLSHDEMAFWDDERQTNFRLTFMSLRCLISLRRGGGVRQNVSRNYFE